MPKIKKRRKSSRYRGSQTARRGAKERTRGSGNQGGKGWAGTGKRGDQKNSLVVKITGGNNYFGKSKTLRRGNVPKKLKVINLSDITSSKDKKVNLKGYKILGEGELSETLTIRASAASQSAMDKIAKAKGNLVLDNATNEEIVGKESQAKPQKKNIK